MYRPCHSSLGSASVLAPARPKQHHPVQHLVERAAVLIHKSGIYRVCFQVLGHSMSNKSILDDFSKDIVFIL